MGDTDDTSSAKRSPASKVAFPSISLREAVERIRKLYESVGNTSCSREGIAQGIGYTSLNGAAASVIAAINMYGFLEKQSGGVYGLSSLGKQIVIPISDEETALGLIAAAKNPPLYQELFRRYLNHPLPKQLMNILSRDFGLTASSAKGATEDFKSSVEYAGLYNNGVLTDGSQDQASKREDSNPEGESAVESSKTIEPPLPSSPTAPLKIPDLLQHEIVIRRGSKALLFLPKDITNSELDWIIKWLEFHRTVLTDEALLVDDDN